MTTATDVVVTVVPMGREVRDIAGAWGDGHVGVDDFTTPATLAMDGLGLFLDPLNWVVGSLIGPIIDWILANVPPCKQAMDYLTGSVESIHAYAEQFQKTSESIADEATQLVEAVNEALKNWTGDGREAFRQAAVTSVELKKGIADSTHGFSDAVYALAGIVAAIKEIVVALIKELVTDLVEKGLLAAAAAVPSLGSAIAAYGAWAAAKYALVMGKVARWFEKLFTKAAQIAQKIGLKGTLFLTIAGLFKKLGASFDKMLAEAQKASSLNNKAKSQDTAAQQRRDRAAQHHENAENSDGRRSRTEDRKGDNQQRKADEKQHQANENRRHSTTTTRESGAGAGSYTKSVTEGGKGYDNDGRSKMGSNPADEIPDIDQ